MRAYLAMSAAAAMLAACSPKGAEPAKSDSAAIPTAGPETPVATKAPAGAYSLDIQHTSLNFRVNHLGFSHYTARFTDMKGQLQFDPIKPETSTLSVQIDPASIQTNNPDKALDFDKELRGANFLDTARYPTMTYVSTKVELTGPDTADITGDLNFRGVTKPVVLHAKFNGGAPAGAVDPQNARIGFSATGTLKRSEFGMGYGVPAPGTTLGVGDDVEIIIETEFMQPGPKAATPAAPES